MYIGNLRKKSGERLTSEEWNEIINQILAILKEKEITGFLKTNKNQIKM
jgi:hypothetical protein